MSAINTTAEQPKFEPPFVEERKTSRDYTDTAEWDASKTPPSRFQKRKGSIYATPSSRDGHVERNRDAVDGFHKAHEKRWSAASISSAASSSSPTLQGLAGSGSERRKSRSGSKGEASN